MNQWCRNAVLLAAVSLGVLGCAVTQPAPVEQRGAAGAGAPIPGGPGAQREWLPPAAGESGLPEAGASQGLDPALGAPPGSLSQGDTPAFPAAPPAPARGSPAVVALLNRANAQQGAGEHEAAAATLERALKIEPHNPWLWHRLAQQRLTQSRLDEAVALAARSNSLASGDRRLMARNWRLIAKVHTAKGEQAAARAAEERAVRLDPRTS